MSSDPQDGRGDADALDLLVIEDSPDDAMLVELALREAGHAVRMRRVETRPQLVEALEDQDWDVIVSDFSMPGFSGLEALDVVREQDLDTPFIILSGHIGEEAAVEAMRHGASDYIDKSRSDRLVPAIEREWRGHDIRREKAQLAEQVHRTQRLEALGQLTGGVAHDFNNLLTVIMGNAELLRARLKDDPKLCTGAELIHMAAVRGAELTARLLTFARKQSMEPRPVDINALVSNVEILMRRTIGEQYAVTLALDEAAANVMSDPGQIEAALLNLVLNARDAMPGGGRLRITTERVTVGPALQKKADLPETGTYVRITVEDQGTGMSPEVLAHVFEPFFTTKEVGKGSGLGLSMVYGFIKQCGGGVLIDSALGQGTRVMLYLPVAPGGSVPQVRGKPAETDPSRAADKVLVLVVEDDEQVRELACDQLSALGYAVLSARVGHEALALLDRGMRPDILFTDVILPEGMNGRDLAEECQRRLPGLQVLFTSGYADTVLSPNGRLEPGLHYLPKPYTLSQLDERIGELRDASRGPFPSPPPR